MADNGTEQLLAKMSLDLTDFKSAISQAKDLLADAFKEENERVAASQAATQEAVKAIQDQVALQKQLQAEAATVVAQEKAKTAVIKSNSEAAKAAAVQAQADANLAVQAKRLEAIAADTALKAQKAAAQASADATKQSILEQNQLAAAKRTAIAEQLALQAKANTAAKEELATIQKQILALRLKNLEEHNISGKGHNAGEEVGAGGGLINSLIGSSFGKENTAALHGATREISGALTGKGLVGSVAQGVLFGGLTAATIEGIGQAVAGLIEKFQELVPELGKLSQMQNTFEALAKGRGIEDATEYLDKLRASTHNLATDTQLLGVANTFLQSPLKMSTEEMLKLTAATVNLARANGKDVPQALAALQQFYTTGQARSLARVTDMNREILVTHNLGTAYSQLGRKQAEAQLAAKAIEEKSDQMGETPLTYQERSKGLEISTARLEEAAGQGIMKSSGFQVVNDILDEMISKFGSLEKGFESFGNTIGNAIGATVIIVRELGSAFTSLSDIVVDILKTIGGLVLNLGNNGLVGSMDAATTAAELMNKKFEDTHPIIANLVKIFGALSTVLRLAKLDMDDFTGKVDAVLNATQGKPVTTGMDRAINDPTAAPKAVVNVQAAKQQYLAAQQQIQEIQKKIDSTNNEFDRDKAKAINAPLVAQQNAISSKAEKDYNDAGQRFTFDNAQQAALDDYTNKLSQIAKLKAEIKKNTDHPTKDTKDENDKLKSQIDVIQKQAQVSKQLVDSTFEKTQASGGLPKNVQDYYNGSFDAIENRIKIQEATNYNKAAEQFTRPEDEKGGIVFNPKIPPDTRNERKTEQDKLAEKKAALAESYAAEKEYLAEIKEADEQSYKDGITKAKDYYNDKRLFAIDEYNDAVSNAAALKKITDESITAKVGRNDLKPEQAKLELQKALDEYNKTVANAGTTLNKQGYSTTKEENQTNTADVVAGINEILNKKKAAIVAEQALTESAFKEQTVSGKDYLDQRLSQIDEEVQATRKAQADILAAKKANSTYTPKDDIEAAKAMLAVIDEAEKKLATLDNNAPDTLAKTGQARFGEIQDALQSRLQISNQGYSGQQEAGMQPNINAQAVEANKAQIASLEDQLEALNRQGQQYSTTWFSVYQSILKAVAAQQQLNTALQASQDILAPMGQVLDAISSQLSGIFGSHFAKGLESAIGSVGKQFGQVQQNTFAMSGGKSATPQADPRLQAITDAADVASKGLINSAAHSSDGLVAASTASASALTVLKNAAAADLASYLQSMSGRTSPAGSTAMQGASSSVAGQPQVQQQDSSSFGSIASVPTVGSPPPPPTFNVSNGLNTAASPLDQFIQQIPQLSKQLVGFVNTFGSAVQGVLNSGSASAGALAGAGGGAAAGQAVGGALHALGAAGSNAGPIGAAIGALVGVIGGMISGNKQEQIQDLINQMNEDFKNMMALYSSNNANLNTTIGSLQNLIAQAQAEMASSKKDSSQFAQLIIQYNEQIQQLQDQAAQTMTSLQQQLDSLGTPTAYQSIISQVASVVQQYEQFASAAQNAQQLAQANEFLAQSLQQMSQTDIDTLNQDEQSAVNNALQLNQLLNQRNQLQYQYLQQVESIQGQGTLTRDQTSAQSKYSQLYQAQVNYSNSLDQINQQIDLAQYQVQAAQTVFNLATTKAGLEAQSLQLQEVGINEDMARIAAMQNLVATLNGSNYSILGGTSNSNPNQQSLAILQLLLQLMGLGGAANGASTGTGSGISAELAALYAQLIALGGGGTTSAGQGQGI